MYIIYCCDGFPFFFFTSGNQYKLFSGQSLTQPLQALILTKGLRSTRTLFILRFVFQHCLHNINCVRRRRTLPNRHVTAGCYVNSRFSVYVAFASLSCVSVYVAFASLSCGDLVERTRVCGITVHSAASDRLQRIWKL